MQQHMSRPALKNPANRMSTQSLCLVFKIKSTWKEMIMRANNAVKMFCLKQRQHALASIHKKESSRNTPPFKIHTLLEKQIEENARLVAKMERLWRKFGRQGVEE